MTNNPKIGLATILFKENSILIGKRINPHRHNSLSFPGGHLEKYENFLDCSVRKIKEETGLIWLRDFRYLSERIIATTNDFFKEENKHYITLFMIAQQNSNSIPKVMEPHKLQGWYYLNWNEIKGKYNELFLPVKNLIKQGFNPYNLR